TDPPCIPSRTRINRPVRASQSLAEEYTRYSKRTFPSGENVPPTIEGSSLSPGIASPSGSPVPQRQRRNTHRFLESSPSIEAVVSVLPSADRCAASIVGSLSAHEGGLPVFKSQARTPRSPPLRSVLPSGETITT